jgi:hypothetical protein
LTATWFTWRANTNGCRTHRSVRLSLVLSHRSVTISRHLPFLSLLQWDPDASRMKLDDWTLCCMT